MINWKPRAAEMAGLVVPGASRWRGPLESVPRHQFIPAWWRRDEGAWVRVDGEHDPDRWAASVYQDVSLVTRVGPHHADHALPGAVLGPGRSTSSSTHPGLLVQMYRHAQLVDGIDVLDVGTGSGYGTALLCSRLGYDHVTTVDIDPYLTAAAAKRLAAIGMHPDVYALDATETAPGAYGRIIATVAVSPIPPAWIAALRPGGRIVTVLDGTRAILTADRLDDGRLEGRIERDWAGFMSSRHAEDYGPGAPDEFVQQLLEQRGEWVRAGRYPLANLEDNWELLSFLAVENPGIEYRWSIDDNGHATQLLWHEDGSWARGSGDRGDAPDVRGGGPRDLWRALEGAKTRWLVEGRLPLYGANATVELDGTIRLRRGAWTAAIGAEGAGGLPT
jgi:protein-L-isoaspartate O-methyltransferase